MLSLASGQGGCGLCKTPVCPQSQVGPAEQAEDFYIDEMFTLQ